MSYPNIDNLKPSIWGGPAWRFLHSVALAYPTLPTNEEKMAAKLFIQSLTKLLPCKECRVNLLNELATDPIDRAVMSKQSFSKWVTSLHNRVNARTGKRQLSPEDVIEIIKGTYAPNPPAPQTPTTTEPHSPLPSAIKNNLALGTELNVSDSARQDLFWPIVGSLSVLTFVLLITIIVVCIKYSKCADSHAKWSR